MGLKDILCLKIPSVAGILFFFVFAVLMYGWFSSSMVIKPARRLPEACPSDFGLKYENVAFKTSDGVKITGWLAYPKEKSDKTVIICHGWGSDSSDILYITSFLCGKTGFNLLYFDFRNHGRSGGKKSSLGKLETRDLTAAVDFLKLSKPESSVLIGLFGVSMGASVAITAAAADKRINAVVADSPFSSFNYIISRYAWLFYKIPKYPFVPLTLLFTRLRLGFDPEEASAARWVSKISPRPVFFICGDADERVPLSESDKLYKAAGEPKRMWTVKGAGHMEIRDMNAPEYEKNVGGFFLEYLK